MDRSYKIIQMSDKDKKEFPKYVKKIIKETTGIQQWQSICYAHIQKHKE